MKHFAKILFKILLWSIGITIAIIMLTIATILFIFDPNDYKLQISQFVQQKTGRSLVITSDVQLSFFPHFGLDLGKVSLGNPPNFPESTFASLDTAHLRIHILPLLNKQIVIGTILLDGATLFLTRTADGRTNWQDLAALASGDKQSSDSKKIDLYINGLDIKNAKIVWDDQTTKTRNVLTDLNLKTSALTLSQPIEIDLSTTVENQGKNPMTGHLDLNTQVILDTAVQRYQLTPLQAAIKVRGQSIFGGQQTASVKIQKIGIDVLQQTVILDTLAVQMLGEAKLTGQFKVQNFLINPTIKGQLQLAECNPQKIIKQLGLSPLSVPNDKLFKTMALQTELQGDVKNGIQLDNLLLRIDDNDLKIPKLQLDTVKQVLTVDALDLHAFGVNLNGNVQIEHAFTQPTLQGKLTVADFNPQEVAKRLNKKLPWNITSVTLETQFTGENNQFSLNDLKLHLDESILQGTVNVQDFQDPAVTFQLDVDSVDVSRYLVTDKSAQQKKAQSPASLPPLDLVSHLNLNGTFKVAKLAFAGLTVNYMALVVATKNGKLSVSPRPYKNIKSQRDS
ncbi:MAG: hypothetical protein BWK79_13450 [Beggiatoa sp. IS2]|nr:MAG: hypothetical protein BWK79_13450 [Beggiatoa sp. IS2]